MKRRAAKLTLFLLLGAILNVAIASGFAAFVNPLSDPKMKIRGLSAPQGDWVHFERTGSSVISVFGVRPAERLPAWVPSADASKPSFESLIVEARGWPMRTVWQRRDAHFASMDGIRLSIKPFETFFSAKYPRAIPLHPIWPGFAINTIFYAAILWLPFAAFGRIRRRRRALRGRCTACGYDLRASPNKLCPECGANVSHPSS